MQRTVSLFEFMPYGAPELLAAGRQHLARALTLSSAAAAAGFVLALQVVPGLWPDAPKPTVRVIVPGFVVPPPPIYIPPEPPAARPSPPSTRPADGPPVPVPDFQAPPDEHVTGPANGPPGPPVREESKVSAPPGPPGPPPLPSRTDIVFTDVLPEPAFMYKPEYPEMAREAGVEGLVVVHALIGTDGSVMRAEVDEKFSIPLLDETARKAALRWTFTPALANGHPVVVWFAIPFRFVLHE